MTVRAYLGQVFAYFGEDSHRDGRVMGVNRGHMAEHLLAEALVYLIIYLRMYN